MRLSSDEIDVVVDAPGAKLRSGPFGPMACAAGRMASGTDLTPLLAGLEDDLCQCPHWGFVREGEIHIRYGDGSEETIRAGDLYYWPPAHTVWFTADTSYVEFSPADEFGVVLDHVTRTLRG